MGCAPQKQVAPIQAADVDLKALEDVISDVKRQIGEEQFQLTQDMQQHIELNTQKTAKRLEMLQMLLSDRGIYGICATDFEGGKEPPSVILSNLQEINSVLENEKINVLLRAAMARGLSPDQNEADEALQRVVNVLRGM